MKVRRYKQENGNIKTYYYDIKENDSYIYGWNSVYNDPPKGTKRVYLDEFKEMGFSEEQPVSSRSCIYSEGMEDKVKQILNIHT